MSHVYFPECGFQNPEAANYCARCGAHLVRPDESETTMTFTPEEAEEEGLGLPEGIGGPALVVRSGGGRSGETFPLDGERITVGRSPDCEIFLDDVTVSRKHAALTRNDSGSYTIEDEGSLNGTFVNGDRVERAPLRPGDQVQIGPHLLVFVPARA